MAAPVRLGFIGVGFITQRAHLPGLQPLVESGEAEFTAFCDLNEETGREQAAAFGAKAVYTDHERMLERESLDAVYVNLPPTLHTDQVRLAAERGLHLFVEKPVSLDMAQAVGFAAAIERAGVVSQVGFNSRYSPSSAVVAERLASRTPRHVQVQLLYSGRPIRWWTSRYEECGGSFVENTIHMVDLVRYWLGDIAQVSAFYHWREPGVGPEPMNLPHAYDVNYRFDSGVTGSFTTSRVLTNVSAGRREVLVICDDALIEWSATRVVENGQTGVGGGGGRPRRLRPAGRGLRGRGAGGRSGGDAEPLRAEPEQPGRRPRGQRLGRARRGAPVPGRGGVGGRGLEPALRRHPRRAGAGGLTPQPTHSARWRRELIDRLKTQGTIDEDGFREELKASITASGTEAASLQVRGPVLTMPAPKTEEYKQIWLTVSLFV